jgi:hypothetical protein
MLLSSTSSRGRAACLATSYTESTVLLDPAVAHGVRRRHAPGTRRSRPHVHFSALGPRFPAWCGSAADQAGGAMRPEIKDTCRGPSACSRGDAPRSTPIAKHTASMVPNNPTRPQESEASGKIYYTTQPPWHATSSGGAGGGARRERTGSSSARRRAAARATARSGCRAMPPKRDCHVGLVRAHRGNDKRIYCRRFEVLHPRAVHVPWRRVSLRARHQRACASTSAFVLCLIVRQQICGRVLFLPPESPKTMPLRASPPVPRSAVPAVSPARLALAAPRARVPAGDMPARLLRPEKCRGNGVAHLPPGRRFAQPPVLFGAV